MSTKPKVAIVGAGMTKFMRRAQETPKELCFEAVRAALDSAQMTLDDIDCVIHGTAPDAFDGIHMKGEYLSDGSGGWKKPYMRGYVGGGTGVFAPIQGWYHLASGQFETALVVCEEKMSSCQPHPQGAFLTIFDNMTERPLKPNLLWIKGVGWNLDTSYWTNRDLAYPQYVENAARMAYKMAGIREPKKEIHIAEPYDPFDYKELHHLEGLLLADKGQAPQLTADGVTARTGNMPSCPSGGLLGVGNPIAAAGLMKVCELFWQLRGEAGLRQVPGQPRTAVAQAWGDLMQVGTVIVCKADGAQK